jgi:hypothetical protein
MLDMCRNKAPPFPAHLQRFPKLQRSDKRPFHLCYSMVSKVFAYGPSFKCRFCGRHSQTQSLTFVASMGIPIV